MKLKTPGPPRIMPRGGWNTKQRGNGKIEGNPRGMPCPHCKGSRSKCIDSRLAHQGQAIRRRRACVECGFRFTTLEVVAIEADAPTQVDEPLRRCLVGIRELVDAVLGDKAAIESEATT